MNRPIHLLFVLSAIFSGCSQPTVAKIGGYVLVYKQVAGDQAPPESMAVALQSRLRAGGFKHATATSDAGGGIRVELPGVQAATADLANAKELIAHQGVIEFRILAERGVNDEVIAAAEALLAEAALPADAAYKWVRHDPAREIAAVGAVTRAGASGTQQVLVLIDRDLTITGDSLASASATLDAQGQPCISGTLNAEGGSKMSALTNNNLQRRLGIILDDELLSAPVIQSRVGSSFQITGRFTQQEVDSMIAILKSGTLPGRLEPTPATEEYVAPK